MQRDSRLSASAGTLIPTTWRMSASQVPRPASEPGPPDSQNSDLGSDDDWHYTMGSDSDHEDRPLPSPQPIAQPPPVLPNPPAPVGPTSAPTATTHQLNTYSSHSHSSITAKHPVYQQNQPQQLHRHSRRQQHAQNTLQPQLQQQRHQLQQIQQLQQQLMHLQHPSRQGLAPAPPPGSTSHQLYQPSQQPRSFHWDHADEDTFLEPIPNAPLPVPIPVSGAPVSHHPLSPSALLSPASAPGLTSPPIPLPPLALSSSADPLPRPLTPPTAPSPPHIPQPYSHPPAPPSLDPPTDDENDIDVEEEEEDEDEDDDEFDSLPPPIIPGYRGVRPTAPRSPPRVLPDRPRAAASDATPASVTVEPRARPRTGSDSQPSSRGSPASSIARTTSSDAASDVAAAKAISFGPASPRSGSERKVSGLRMSLGREGRSRFSKSRHPRFRGMLRGVSGGGGGNSGGGSSHSDLATDGPSLENAGTRSSSSDESETDDMGRARGADSHEVDERDTGPRHIGQGIDTEVFDDPLNTNFQNRIAPLALQPTAASAASSRRPSEPITPSVVRRGSDSAPRTIQRGRGIPPPPAPETMNFRRPSSSGTAETARLRNSLSNTSATSARSVELRPDGGTVPPVPAGTVRALSATGVTSTPASSSAPVDYRPISTAGGLRTGTLLECVVDILRGTPVLRRKNLLQVSEASIWLMPDLRRVQFSVPRKGNPPIIETIDLQRVRKVKVTEREIVMEVETFKKPVDFIFPSRERAEVWVNGLMCLVPSTSIVKRRNRRLNMQYDYDPLRDSWNGKSLETRKRIDEFILLGSIGRGSFGKVKLALSEKDLQFYAVKVLSKSMMAKRNRSAPFERNMSVERTRSGNQLTVEDVNEIVVLKDLDHKNVMKMKSVFDDVEKDTMYIVVEYLPNGPIMNSSKLGGEMPLKEEQARSAFVDVVKGLAYLHHRRIVHRDIKPDNLLRSGDGTVKISDFGAAMKYPPEEDRIGGSGFLGGIGLDSAIIGGGSGSGRGINGADYDDRENDDDVQRHGVTVGTPAFTAPELCLSDKSPPCPARVYAADMWSLGATLFYMLYGRVPFMAKTVFQMYDAICSNPLKFPEGGSVSPAAQEVMRMLLERSPRERATVQWIVRCEWLRNCPEIADKVSELRALVARLEEEAVAEARRHSTNASTAGRRFG